MAVHFKSEYLLHTYIATCPASELVTALADVYFTSMGAHVKANSEAAAAVMGHAKGRRKSKAAEATL